MECVDISHFGGRVTVGAISTVMEGQVKRSLGRTYRIKTPVQGDDYGAMTELLTRRFVRVRKKDKGWEAPDLLIVDGGRGQLSVAVAVLRELEIDTQPVVALAKERVEKEGAESDRVFIPGRKNPIPLKARVSPLHMLALARDEAHRLAISYQRKLRRKKTLKSELDAVPGVGPKMKKTLLSKFGSVKKIRKASAEDLCDVPGVGLGLAKRIKETLGG
jgi:excinuclease ABC subunit C